MTYRRYGISIIDFNMYFVKLILSFRDPREDYYRYCYYLTQDPTEVLMSEEKQHGHHSSSSEILQHPTSSDPLCVIISTRQIIFFNSTIFFETNQWTFAISKLHRCLSKSSFNEWLFHHQHSSSMFLHLFPKLSSTTSQNFLRFFQHLFSLQHQISHRIKLSSTAKNLSQDEQLRCKINNRFYELRTAITLFVSKILYQSLLPFFQELNNIFQMRRFWTTNEILASTNISIQFPNFLNQMIQIQQV